MTAGRYYRLTPRFWQDRDVRFWPEDVRWLAVYLISSPHRNMTGLFYCPLTYMQSDLQWPASRLQKAFEGLVGAGFIEYDRDAEVVLITNALKHDSPGNENQVKGAINALQTVPETYLLAHLLALADEYSATLAEAMRNAFEGLSEAVRTTVAVSDSVPVTEPVAAAEEISAAADCPNPQTLVEIWNAVCGDTFPKVLRLTAGRRQHAQSRLREKDRDEAFWHAYFERIKASSFCRGDKKSRSGEQPWRASFDWAIHNEENVFKVLEGRYDDVTAKPKVEGVATVTDKRKVSDMVAQYRTEAGVRRES